MTSNIREVSLGEVCEIKQGRYLAPNQMEEVPTRGLPSTCHWWKWSTWLHKRNDIPVCSTSCNLQRF
jgi:hypothetical protein